METMAQATTTDDERVTFERKRGTDWIVGADSDISPIMSVVMPTMNEEAGVRECIERVRRAVAELEVPTEIVVSDSSTDRTPEVARELGAIVVEPDKMGYGYAYRYAFERTRGEYIVMGDADTTYDFEQIPRLREHLEETGADIVMGSRLGGEIKPGAMPPLHQYVGNPLLTKFLNTFYDAGVSDAHSGFRIFWRDVLDTLEFESDGMEFASEMVMKAGANGLAIEEVPITYHEREGEATLDSFRDGWRHVRFMLKNAPGYLFTAPAVGFGLFGVAIVAVSMVGVELGSITFGLQTLIGGILFLLVGYQVGSLALFSSVAANPIREQRDPLTRAIRDRFTLETGATIGVILSALGTGYMGYGVVVWMIEGYAAVPSASWNLLAATVVVLGIQTVFTSFFLSLLASSHSRPSGARSSEEDTTAVHA